MPIINHLRRPRPVVSTVIAILMATAIATGCAATYEDGKRALEAGDYDRAADLAHDHLADDPESPWANQLMAETLVARDQHDQAMPHARRADESGAFPVRSPRTLGDIHLAQDDPVDAAGAYHRARRADPEAVDDADYIEALEEGIARSRVRADHDIRWQLANWLVEADPDHPDVAPEEFAVIRRARAIELRRDGDYAEAVRLLEEALDEDPAHLRGEALDLGKIYARMEMPDDADRAWRAYLDEGVDTDESIQRHLDVAGAAARHRMLGTAVEILEDLPDRIDAPRRRGEVMLELARYQLQADRRADGRRTVYDYLELHTGDAPDGRASPVPYRRAAELAEELDRTRLRINILERAAEEAEPTRTLTRQLADIYAHRAQLESARDLMERYVERHDDAYTAETVAADWARDRHNFELAETFYRRAVDRPEVRPETLHALADVLGQLGDYDEMSRSVDDYLEARQTSDDALSSAAGLLVDHERREEAEELLERLHDRAPDRRDVTRQFADLYFESGRPAEAAAVWERWIRARGDDPEDIASVAGLLAREGDLDRAAELYERAGEAGVADYWLEAADVHDRRDDQAALARSLETYVREADHRTPALIAAAERFGEAEMTSRRLDTLLELVDRHPDRWDFHRQLTELLFDQQRHTEAFDHLHHFVDDADDPGQALTRIGAEWTSPDRAPWMIDLFRHWYDDPDAKPTLLRLVGDAYRALAHHDQIARSDADRARNRARTYYRQYLEQTEGDSLDWAGFAQELRRKEMWYPAATAFERSADHQPSSTDPLAHAETLLQLGETGRAVEILEAHFHDRQRSPDLAGRIAELLVDFALYDQAAEYAGHLLVSGHDSDLGRGFRLMVEIYHQSEDYDRLAQLSSDVLERTSNEDRGRRTATNALEELGQWELTAEILEGIDAAALHQFAIQAGHHRYRDGDVERAFRAYEEAAEHAARPETAWVEAGRFLERRGDVQRATAAFDRAVQANPDDIGARAARGSFAIRRGDVETGWSDYATARSSTSTFRASRRAEFFEAFESVGHFDSARTVFDHFDEDDQSPPDRLLQQVGTWELQSPDRQTRRRGLDRIDTASWGMLETLEYLDETGHHDETLRLIETEFDEGDATTAAVTLLNRSTPMSRLVGWNQQRQWLDAVIDPLQRTDGRLLGPIGDYRARVGDLDDGRGYLRAAVDYEPDYRPQYAHTLLSAGDTEEAMEVFETWLRDNRAGPRALRDILRRFELAGADAEARRFLDRIATDPSMVEFALPAWTHYRLEARGDPDRVVDDIFETVESMAELPTTAFDRAGDTGTIPGLSADDLLDRALVDSLRTMAALGFPGAVEAALTDDSLADEPDELDELRLQLALTAGDDDRARRLLVEIVDAADGHRHRQQTRIRLARHLISTGDLDLATRLVDEALDEQTHFDDHRPATLRIGLQFLAGADDLDETIDAYLQRVPNRRDARLTLIDELHRMGLDAPALRLARRQMERTPTTDASLRAATMAFADGDETALREALQTLFAVGSAPVEQLEGSLLPRLPGAEPPLALAVVEHARQARPHDLDWTIEHARILFDAGDQPEARTMLTDALQARDYHPRVLTKVASMLDEQNLDVELADVLAPAVADAKLWPESTIVFAEAELALGRDDRAADRLESLSETTDAPAMWRMELGDRLVSRHLFDQLDVVLAPVDPDSAGPYLEYLQGVAALAGGDATTGVNRLREANAQGVDRFRTHHAGIRAALHGGDTDAARSLMGDLLDLPTRDDDIVSLPVQVLLSAAKEMPDGPQLIRTFLRDERPRLLDGRGAFWTEFSGQLARTFEFVGDPEGAFGFYRDRLWQARFLGDDGPVSTYLNNLAYSYATTDTDIEAGLDKVRRAMVLHPERTASFIDTLGWLLYRDGNLEAADREIRRALRTYHGDPSGLDKQLEHLQTISAARGLDDQVADIATHRNRLPPGGLDW